MFNYFMKQLRRARGEQGTVWTNEDGKMKKKQNK